MTTAAGKIALGGVLAAGTVSAVNSATSITVLFPGGAPAAAQYALRYANAGSGPPALMDFLATGAAVGQVPVILSAAAVDSTYLTFTLASAPTTPAVGDAVLVW